MGYLTSFIEIAIRKTSKIDEEKSKAVPRYNIRNRIRKFCRIPRILWRHRKLIWTWFPGNQLFAWNCGFRLFFVFFWALSDGYLDKKLFMYPIEQSYSYTCFCFLVRRTIRSTRVPPVEFWINVQVFIFLLFFREEEKTKFDEICRFLEHRRRRHVRQFRAERPSDGSSLGAGQYCGVWRWPSEGNFGRQLSRGRFSSLSLPVTTF